MAKHRLQQEKQDDSADGEQTQTQTCVTKDVMMMNMMMAMYQMWQEPIMCGNEPLADYYLQTVASAIFLR